LGLYSIFSIVFFILDQIKFHENERAVKGFKLAKESRSNLTLLVIVHACDGTPSRRGVLFAEEYVFARFFINRVSIS
jgi:hypothetical protein